MNYEELRRCARSGDALLVSGKGFFSRIIRIATATNISHVAMLVWISDTLWVAEMKEGRGYTLTPASIWVLDATESATVYYGKAPAVVRNNGERVTERALHYRNRKYGWLSLSRVWLGQFFRGYRKTLTIVCSTFVGRVWNEASGHNLFSKIPTPGDIFNLCTPIRKIDV